MAGEMPGTPDEMLNIHGIGRAKVKKYAKIFLPIIHRYRKRHQLGNAEPEPGETFRRFRFVRFIRLHPVEIVEPGIPLRRQVVIMKLFPWMEPPPGLPPGYEDYLLADEPPPGYGESGYPEELPAYYDEFRLHERNPSPFTKKRGRTQALIIRNPAGNRFKTKNHQKRKQRKPQAMALDFFGW